MIDMMEMLIDLCEKAIVNFPLPDAITGADNSLYFPYFFANNICLSWMFLSRFTF